MKILKLIILSPSLFFAYVLFILSSKRELIESDIAAMNKRCSTDKGLVGYLLDDKYFRSLYYYRLGDNKLTHLCSCILPPCDSLHILPTMKIGESFSYAHPICTFINAKSIGRNFTIRQCTTIGNKIDGRNDLVPIIGDNVTLGANVCIIGDIKIGNNVIVGAGTVIVKDVPDNTVVVGNPMRIISKS